jgi:hypothetical protein
VARDAAVMGIVDRFEVVELDLLGGKRLDALAAL